MTGLECKVFKKPDDHRHPPNEKERARWGSVTFVRKGDVKSWEALTLSARDDPQRQGRAWSPTRLSGAVLSVYMSPRAIFRCQHHPLYLSATLPFLN